MVRRRDVLRGAAATALTAAAGSRAVPAPAEEGATAVDAGGLSCARIGVPSTLTLLGESQIIVYLSTYITRFRLDARHNAHIVAKSNSEIRWGVDQARALKADDRLRSVVVFALGNKDARQLFPTRAEVLDQLRELRQVTGSRRLLVWGLARNRPQHSEEINRSFARINAAFAQFARDTPAHITWYDWQDWIDRRGDFPWGGDGVHLPIEGAVLRARRMAEVVDNLGWGRGGP